MFDDIINSVAEEERLPPTLLNKMITMESSYDPKAVSPKGAKGLMQLMPVVQKMYGVTDPTDPVQNIRAGAKYYNELRKEFGPTLAFAAYNWGPQNVREFQAKRKAMPSSVQNYVERLSPYVEAEALFAPMDLEGNSGKFPRVMPVSQEETLSPNIVPPKRIGESKMNDYENMAIFNPYIQLALGIMAGNTGRTKSEAFANAMGGGAGAINAAQRSAAYAGQVRAQTDHYELLKQKTQLQQQYAMERAQDPNLTPEQRRVWEMAAKTGNLGEATNQLNQMTSNALQEKRIDLEERRLQETIDKNNAKEQGTTINLEETHPMNGWRVSDGKLYDERGIEVTGKRKEWAQDMLPRPTNEVMSQKEWNNKNSPEMLITYDKMNNWVKPDTGEELKEVIPQQEAIDKGFTYKTDKELGDLRSTLYLRDQVQDISKYLFGENGVYKRNRIPAFTENPPGAIIGTGKRGLASIGFGEEEWQENLRIYNEKKKTLRAALARAQEQTGTLTKQDVEDAMALFPEMLPNPLEWRFQAPKENEAKRMINEMVELLKKRGLNISLEPEALTTKSGIQLYKR
jgi:hypothetical protein